MKINKINGSLWVNASKHSEEIDELKRENEHLRLVIENLEAEVDHYYEKAKRRQNIWQN